MKRKKLQVVINVFFILMVFLNMFPLMTMLSAAFSDNNDIIREGYRLIPKTFSLDAFDYVLKDSRKIVNAYGISIIVTLSGVVCGMLFMALLAYPMSRRDFSLRRGLMVYVVITMLFNGGLVPTYLMYVDYLHIKNTLWALIIPRMLVSAFYVMIMRTFFQNSIPGEIIEAAQIDGCSEYGIFFRIVMPLSLPVLATVGLMQTIGYWNDWYNGLIYLTDSSLFSIQNLLNRILFDVQYLTNSPDVYAADMAVSLPTETARMAIVVLGTMPLLLAYPFFQKYLVSGLTLGSVKG